MIAVMRILFLDPADFIGGAELFQRELFQSLSEDVEGIFVTAENNIFPLPQRIQKITIPLPRLRPFRPVLFFQTILRLRKIIQEKNIALVHSNSVRAGLFARFLGIPWTHFVHDFTTPKFLAPVFRHADHIFCCSEVVRKDILHKKASSSLDRTSVIPPLLPNKAEYERIQANWKKNALFRVSFVGRIDTWKGQDVLLKVAKKCLEDGRDDIHFSLFGTSSSHDMKTVAFEESLHNFKEEHHLTNVSFRGYCDSAEIFSETDLLIHASTKPEPFGRTIAEAVLLGIPVIASKNAGAVPSFLSTPSVFFLENPKDVEELFRLLQKAKQDFSFQAFPISKNTDLWKLFSNGEKRMETIWHDIIAQ